jgi:hypothetical protein
MNKNVKIDFKKTPERVELVKRMADNNRVVAMEAQQAFAEYIRPAVEYVLNAKVTSNAVYRDLPFSKNSRPTIPLDNYLGLLGSKENTVRIWSQQIAGGLATNLLQGLGEYTFQVYRLDTAISFYNDYIRDANLGHLTQGIDLMINQLAVKQERNAWSPLLMALAQATSGGGSHIIESQVPGVFQLEDLNQMFIKIDRMYTSYVGGTPDGATPAGLTDLFVSPEIIGQIRAFAYNPMNVRGGYKSDGTEATSSIALPDSIREQVFRGGGLLSIYDVNIHKLIELGKGAKYNAVFDGYYGGTFDPATQEVLLGFDLSRDVILRPVVTDDDFGGGSVVVLPDDQFFLRSEKTGFFARLQEGRVLLDDRVLLGMVV